MPRQMPRLSRGWPSRPPCPRPASQGARPVRVTPAPPDRAALKMTSCHERPHAPARRRRAQAHAGARACDCALLVPKEMKVEHLAGVQDLTDEQLDAAIAAIREMLDRRTAAAQTIDGEVVEVKGLAGAGRAPAS